MVIAKVKLTSEWLKGAGHSPINHSHGCETFFMIPVSSVGGATKEHQQPDKAPIHDTAIITGHAIDHYKLVQSLAVSQL